ncbi:hypothetical protein GQ457_03G011210 [Hibiscus cannabinus]
MGENPETMGKKEDKSTLDPWDVNSIGPMLGAMVKAITEMDKETKDNHGYIDLVSEDDLTFLDKTMQALLVASLQSMSVSNSRKRKALALQNDGEACFLPKRNEILDPVNEECTKRKNYLEITGMAFENVEVMEQGTDPFGMKIDSVHVLKVLETNQQDMGQRPITKAHIQKSSAHNMRDAAPAITRERGAWWMDVGSITAPQIECDYESS